MLIHNYGLFWRRSVISADGPWPRSGELLGVGVRQKRRGKVDFSRQRGIYALYDDNFRLIYVGQAGKGERRLYNRLRSHSLNNLAERWTRFSWFGVVPVEEDPVTGALALHENFKAERAPEIKEVLDHLEAILIMAGEPIRNSKGGIFGKGVVHYRQATASSSVNENEVSYDDYEDE